MCRDGCGQYFLSEKDAIACAIDEILDELINLLDNDDSNIKDVAGILQLIKDLKYEEAIKAFNNLNEYSINIEECIGVSYKNKIIKNIKKVEDYLKELVFK